MTETRSCQSCKKEFIIEPDDFGFYEQMKVPPPTWCPQCRLTRRLNWQGYSTFYKWKCDFTGDNVLTTVHPDSGVKIYRQDIWWGDQWDPLSYGRDYDFSRPFFVQLQELFKEVPSPSLNTAHTTMINSEYCNGASDCKNCYLVFRCTAAEDSGYLNIVINAKSSFDCSLIGQSELSYGSLDIEKCYQAFFSQHCEECSNIWFCKDLVGCSNCVGCINLRNQNYCWFNEQLTKEEYNRRFKELNLGSKEAVEDFKRKAEAFFLTQPRRQFHGRNNVNVSGDYFYNCKNVKDSYEIRNGENLRYCYFLKSAARNSYDYSIFGDNSEWIYESGWVGLNAYNSKFCAWNYYCHDVEYCFGVMSSGNLFGCKGIKKGQYCILNKQYSKEDYSVMVEKIKKHMDEMPYTDKLGRVHEYGGMMPVELSPWAYNEAVVQDYMPKNREQALAEGFLWRDKDEREYRPATSVLPPHIKDVPEMAVKEVLKCSNCGKKYQIIPMELAFLKRFNIPVPGQCFLCRDRARLGLLNPLTIFNRTCAKCSKTIQTSYAPDRPEIVYCETCYQQEVV